MTRRVLQHVAERRYRQIRQAERSVCDAGARKVKCPKTGLFRQPLGAIGVDDADDLQRPFRLNRLAKA